MTSVRSKSIRSFLRRLREDRRGTMAAVMAVAAVPIIGLAGVGIDTARGYMLKQRMSQALDAAALAGGRAVYSPSRDADIQKFYFANIEQGYLGATLQPPAIAVGQNNETITLTATAELPSTFTRVLGVEEMNVQARVVVRRANRGLELVMVLDSTGSMQDDDKIGKLKSAANNLLDILYGANNDTAEKLYVGVAPYTTAVNIGNNRTGWLTGYNASAYNNGTWRGCVEARAYPYEESQADAAPSAQPFKPYFYATTYNQSWYYNGNKVTNSYTSDNSWTASNAGSNESSHTGRGPNKYCQLRSKAEILPLQGSKAKAKQAINAMEASSVGTLTNVGLAWGWRMLSPNWRGLWGTSGQWASTTPAELPLDYNTPGMDKAVILLTDGLTNMPAGNGQTGCNAATGAGPCTFPYGTYTAFGRLSEGRLGTVSKSAADTELNNRIAETCTAMKAQNIKIYSIVLDTTDTTVQDLFRNCASAPEFYYNSPTADQLAGVFQQIALQLSQLRLQE
jgi:Flp pilus assembly protein TadG